jgi:hypothetical protein
MIDTISWSKLTQEQQDEFNLLLPTFIQQVINSDAKDGIDFKSDFKIEKRGDKFVFTNGKVTFLGVESRSWEVMSALMKEAAQNYGR